ncbi:MAG: hypothetical protein AB7O66_03475 [Limisphaerales bacterium]
MPVHLDQLTSEVVPEPEPQGVPVEPREGAIEPSRLSQLLARLAEDRRRVAAEGFDD